MEASRTVPVFDAGHSWHQIAIRGLQLVVAVVVSGTAVGCASPDPSMSAIPRGTVATAGADAGSSLPAATATPEPPTGEVSCTPAGPIVSSPVEASPDGVHFRVSLPENVLAEVRDVHREGTLDGIGGPGASISQLAPGDYLVGCRDYVTDQASPNWARLSVVDPRGLWVDDRVIDCPDRSTGITDYVSGAQGEKGDLSDALRRHVQGLLPDDQVTAAGYPEASPRKVRIVRSGRVVALAEYEEFETPGNWVLGVYTYCGSIGPRG